MWRYLLALALILTPSVVHANLYINELLPDPSTSDDTDEWVELYNSSDLDIEITGYLLEDATAHQITIPTATISAHGYYLWQREGSSLSLNNSGEETISLYDPTHTLVDHFTYSTSKTDQSWARIPDGVDNWLLSTPTIAITNPTPTPEPTPTPTVTPTPTPSPSTTSSLSSEAPTPSEAAGEVGQPSPTPTPKPSLTSSPEGTVAGLMIESIHLQELPSSRSEAETPNEVLSSPKDEVGPSLNLDRATIALITGSGLILLSLAGYLGYRQYLVSRL